MSIDPKEITPETPEKDLPEYWEAAEAYAIAEGDVRPAYHGERLEGMAIVYLFKKKAPKKGERVQLGVAAKRSAKDQVIANITGGFCHFVITLGWNLWKDFETEKKRALIDHELCHCAVDFDKKGNPVPKIRHHDFEEFYEIVERHGLWKVDLEQAAESMETAKQLSLFDPEHRHFSDHAGMEGRGEQDAGETTITISQPGTDREVTMTDKQFTQAAREIGGRRP